MGGGESPRSPIPNKGKGTMAMNTTTVTPCPDCLTHRGWSHGDESRRKEPRDVCRSCLGSGVVQALHRA